MCTSKKEVVESGDTDIIDISLAKTSNIELSFMVI